MECYILSISDTASFIRQESKILPFGRRMMSEPLKPRKGSLRHQFNHAQRVSKDGKSSE